MTSEAQSSPTTERPSKIVVAVDFSEASRRALEVALEFGRVLKARIHLVHAYDVPAAVAHAYGVVLPDALAESVVRSANQRLQEMLGRVRKAGLSGESHLVEGSPPQVIADTAAALGADLIVMGTRGLTGLKHALLGSVVERTLRLAPCPVLTVRVEADQA